MAEEAGVRIDCHFMAVELFLKRCKKSYDYIFLDPPFPYKFRRELIETISSRNLLNEGGTAIIHYPHEDPLPEEIGELSRADHRVYGRSNVDFFRKINNKSTIET
jgi:16S rRNA G966 N2-methylase RsmD